MEIGLLLLRVVVGLTMAGHGLQKLAGWFGGYGLEGTAGYMRSLGLPDGRRAALLAGAAETAGGLLLVLGLFTPLAAAMIIGVMGVATATQHHGKGYWNTGGGFELPAILAAAAGALAFTGAGAISLDAALGLPLAGWTWGLLAIAVGLLGAVLQLTVRRREAAERPA